VRFVVTPEAVVLSFDWGRLRRAAASGDPSLVLASVERILRGHEAPSYHREAVDAFYDIFWVALEDKALGDQAGDIDARSARSGRGHERLWRQRPADRWMPEAIEPLLARGCF